MEAPTEETRAARAENYRIKREHGFKCDECGTATGVLVVDVGGEPATICEERCLDRRRHKIRPHQWDEARDVEERARQARGRR